MNSKEGELRRGTCLELRVGRDIKVRINALKQIPEYPHGSQWLSHAEEVAAYGCTT